jgi:ABC-type uncharacterized transport system ATPase subunit
LHRDVAVLRTLEYFGELHGMTRTEARSATRAGLKNFNLADRERERIDALSGGPKITSHFCGA